MTPAIELSDAFRIYGSGPGATVALQGLDLAVAPGEIVVVLGPSGAGKSTLLRVLAGLEWLTAGTARVLGTDLGLLDDAGTAAFRAAHVGLLDQHYARSLSPDLTCRHTVALQLQLLGAPPTESLATADALLERVGLGARAGDRPDSLSGGEQQRVAVCAAVAHRPGLLLADEPAGELDAANAEVVYRLLGELVRDANATALIVSHDAAAATIADRLVYIRDGRIVEEARPGFRRALVISRKGWARLPHELAPLAPRFADASIEGGRIVITPVGEELAEAPAGATGPRVPPGDPMAEVTDVGKRWGDRVRIRRRLPELPRRGLHRPRRPVREREDDAPPHAGRARAAERGIRSWLRESSSRRSAGPSLQIFADARSRSSPRSPGSFPT